MTNKKAILGISFAAAFAVSMIFAQSAIAGAPPFPEINKAEYKVDSGVGKFEIKTDGTIPTEGSSGAFGYGVVTGATGNGPENVLALTTHLCVSDHPLQGANGNCNGADDALGVVTQLTNGGLVNENHDGAEMHAHILDLKPVDGSACDGISNGDAELEVDIPRSLAGIPLPGNPYSGDATSYPNNLLAGSGALPGDSASNYEIEVKNSKLEVKMIPSGDLFGTEAAAFASFGIHPLTDHPTDDTFVTSLCLTDLVLYPVQENGEYKD